MNGKVAWFSNKKGFGFLEGEDGKHCFVHYSSIVGEGFKKLDAGEKVTYDISKCEKGFAAYNVVKAEQ